MASSTMQRLLAVLLGAVAGLLRRASATVRYGVLLGGLVLMAACPVVKNPDIRTSTDISLGLRRNLRLGLGHA